MSLNSPVILVLASVLAGALIAAQGPIFARMASHSGGALQAALIAFGLGFLVILTLIFIAGSAAPKIAELRQAPNWTWFGGVIGAAMVMLSIVAIPRIGVGVFISSVICGQLVAAILLDHFGAFGLEVNSITTAKLFGAGLLLSGLYLIIFK